MSKATEPADVDRISAYLDMPVYGVIPLDEDVRIAERIGVPVFEHAPDSVAVAAITRIAERRDAEERLAPRGDSRGEQRDPPGAPA